MSKIIPKKPALVYNSIEHQAKTAPNSLTIGEWNRVVNILKQQANLNTKYLENLHRLLFYDWNSDDSGYLVGGVLPIFYEGLEGVDLLTDLQGKVDKVPGMGLSKNNFTDEYKNKVDSVIGDVSQLDGRVDNVADDVSQLQTGKQDKLVAGTNITINPDTNIISASGGGGGEVNLNEMAYFNYAGRIYGAKYNLLPSAWEHSLTVDPLEISEDSEFPNIRGTAQYPNGETEGVIIPQGVTSIGDYAFLSWASNNQPLVIPESVTSIGNTAFSGWESNNHPLVIPNSVTSIGDEVFADWKSNNQPIVIPNSVTSIGEYAFSGWESNNHPLVIPNSVTSIANLAFRNWSLVPYVEIQAITPPTLEGAGAFMNQGNAPIYVPDESVDDYKTAENWSDLADRIFPISDKDNTYTKGEIDLMIGDIENALDAILGV